MAAKKYLITGSSGFVGQHFLGFLEKQSPPAVVLGLDREPPHKRRTFRHLRFSFRSVDWQDFAKVKRILKQFRPDYLLHLASFSSISFSWREPQLSFQNNTAIFLNLLEAVRQLKLTTRILVVGSAEQYGRARAVDLPLRETLPLNPPSPYACAKVAQELLAKIYVQGYGLKIILTRSFNHLGTGQKGAFAIPSFARQLISLKKRHRSHGQLLAGNLSSVRDFVDVRDVVRAYDLLLKRGRNGEVYNVCSGAGTPLKEVLEKMAGLCGVKITVKIDPKLIRPTDVAVTVGHPGKIKKLGWAPTIPLEESLRDVLASWASSDG